MTAPASAAPAGRALQRAALPRTALPGTAVRGAEMLAAAMLGAVAAMLPRDGVAASPAPGLAEQVVLAGAEIGGSLIDLSRFTDRRDVEAVLADVRRAWAADPSPVMQSRRGDWQVLTRAAGRSIESVEVRARGAGAEGRIIRTRSAPRSESAPEADWLAAAIPDREPSGPAVTHRDAGRVLTTRVVLTRLGSEAAAAALRRALRDAGFRPVPGAATGDAAIPVGNGRGRVVVMARGDEEVAVTVSDHGERRAIVMHRGRTR